MRNISVTNASNSASKDYYHTLVEGIILCSAFVVEAVLIAVGNLLTVVLFAFNRKLRRKSLFLVINMAFSDAMLGTVCLPLYVYLIVGPVFQLWENAYELQMRLDIFVHVLHTIFTHSSLISAVFISFERFYAIYWPLKHRRLSVREYFIIILTTWFLAIGLRCPQRRTLLSSRTFLLRMGSFPTGISICCLCLKHWHFDEVPWGRSGKYHFTAAKQICAEYETTDKNAVVYIYDCHTFLASSTHW